MAMVIVGLNLVMSPFSSQHERASSLVADFSAPMGLLSKQLFLKIKTPDALILGSSRAEASFDPKDFQALTHSTYAYNLGFGLAHLSWINDLLQAMDPSTIKHVLLVLDFESFNQFDPIYYKNRISFQKEISPGPTLIWNQMLLRYFSKESTWLSLMTTMLPSERKIPFPYHLQGDWSEAYIRKQQELSGGADRYHQLQEWFLGCLVRSSPWYRFELAPQNQEWQALEHILQWAHQHDIDLKMVIPALHHRYMELLQIQKAWPVRFQWYQELVKLDEEVAQWTKQTPYEIWDFSLSSKGTSPQFFDGEHSSDNVWFWDLSHPNQRVGTLMLNQMYGDASVKNNEGIRLDNATLESHWEKMNQAHERYRQEFLPEMIALRQQIEELQRYPQRCHLLIGE